MTSCDAGGERPIEQLGAWSRLDLGDAMLADGPLREIVARITAAAAGPRSVPPVVAFVRHESEGRLHCSVIVYFSPAAFDVASALGARRCARPAPGGLGVLAGPGSAVASLFPESEAAGGAGATRGERDR